MSQMFRAVAAPPQDTMRSTPAARNFLIAALVLSAGGLPAGVCTTSTIDREAGRGQGADAHVARDRRPVDVGPVPSACDQPPEFLECFERPRIGDWYRATPCRLVRDIVAALEPDTHTHSSDRIYDEAYVRHRARVRNVSGNEL
jgi:hypothetical protein